MYDGTSYHGSQRQKPGIQTIQGEVEKVLRQLDWNGESLLMAGRTDAGVHALGQVIAFDLEWNHPPVKLMRAVNSLLPADISLKEVSETSADFHPRYAALARRYHYRMYCSPVRDPLRERFAWQIWPELSLKRVRKAAEDLPGVHDFGAFGSAHKPGGCTVREIFSTNLRQDGDEVTFEVLGNAFLYHMVRHIVQVLVEIGQKHKKVDAVQKYLRHPAGETVQGLAPARGLSLVEVLYDRKN